MVLITFVTLALSCSLEAQVEAEAPLLSSIKLVMVAWVICACLQLLQFICSDHYDGGGQVGHLQ